MDAHSERTISLNRFFSWTDQQRIIDMKALMAPVFVSVLIIACSVLAQKVENRFQIYTGERVSLEGKGAAVPDAGAAKILAFRGYCSRMIEIHSGVDALEGPLTARVFRLGLDIPAFAAKGDEIWEVRIFCRDQLRAIIWVDPYSSKTFFVIAPWTKNNQ